MAWFSVGIQTNPATDVILADTGAMADGGTTKLKIVLAATVAAVCTIEHRDSANTANINAQVIACAAGAPYDLEIPGAAWAAGERFRVRLNAGIVGSVQASIFML